MAKKIILCCDGTGNEYGDHNTNVVKLFSMLKRDQTQVAFYDPGLGTFSAPQALTAVMKWGTRVYGLATGYGISQNIADAYQFLMSHYEKGDQIYLFGFSRGAYTARAVAAMVYKCGLLQKGNDNLVPYALKMFKKEKRLNIYKGFKKSFSQQNVGVHFIGVWDTVKSVGWLYDPLTLQFTMNNPIVKTIRHAISIDERRAFFRQNLFGTRYKKQDIKQVWFAGVHSDVGGSYPEQQSGLSQLALEWMVRESEKAGLKFDPTKKNQIIPKQKLKKTPDMASTPVPPDHKGMIHNSLTWHWWPLEILPISYKDKKTEYKERFRFNLARRRSIPENSVVHISVVKRQKDLGYAPKNLPSKFRVEKKPNKTFV